MKNVILVLATVLLFGCGSSSSSNLDNDLQVLASNVIFTEALASSSKALDTTTKVLAQNVVIDATTNRLESENLQDAFDSELAVDLSSLLPGTTWNIENKQTGDFNYAESGQIVFTENNTFTVTGDLAVAGIGNSNDICVPDGAVNYELINDLIIYATYTEDDRDKASIMQVVVSMPNRMVIIGRSSCSFQTVGVSILTKVE